MRLAALLTDLAACLCAELTPDGADGPPLCSCGVVPGNQVAAELGQCGDSACGQAWVRLVRAYPATAAGVQPEISARCGTYLGADIEVGIMRCLEVPYDGSPPTAEDLAQAATQQIDDAEIMRKAISCCPALEEEDYSLINYVPHGPRGLIVGGWWTVSVAL